MLFCLWPLLLVSFWLAIKISLRGKILSLSCSSIICLSLSYDAFGTLSLPALSGCMLATQRAKCHACVFCAQTVWERYRLVVHWDGGVHRWSFTASSTAGCLMAAIIDSSVYKDRLGRLSPACAERTVSVSNEARLMGGCGTWLHQSPPLHIWFWFASVLTCDLGFSVSSSAYRNKDSWKKAAIEPMYCKTIGHPHFLFIFIMRYVVIIVCTIVMFTHVMCVSDVASWLMQFQAAHINSVAHKNFR